MEIRDSEVKSGAFIVLAVIALVVLLFSVGDLKSHFRSTVEYHTYLSDVKFLKPHSPVTYGGLRVGEIKEIRVAEDRFGQLRVTIQVGEEVEVKEDSILSLEQDGVLGSKYIEISPGTASAKRASSGAELKGVIPSSITDLTAALDAPIQKLNFLLESLNKVFGREVNQKNLSEIMAEGKELLVELREEVKKLGNRFDRTGEKAQEALDEIQGLIKENRPEISSLLKNLDDLSSGLIETASRLDSLIQRGDGLVVQNNKNLYETIRALRDAAHHLEQGAKRVRADPSILLFGAKETPEELRRADETEIRLKGRTRRYEKEAAK